MKHISFTRDSRVAEGIGVCEDVTEAVCCGRNEGSTAGARLRASGSAGDAKSELWASGYDSCTDRGEHPPSRPAGEPHPGPQGTQTDALASLKWYWVKLLFMQYKHRHKFKQNVYRLYILLLFIRKMVKMEILITTRSNIELNHSEDSFKIYTFIQWNIYLKNMMLSFYLNLYL